MTVLKLLISRNLSQWPFIIGDRLTVSHSILSTLTIKSFEVLGWSEGTCTCNSTGTSTSFPNNFFGSLMSFWKCCLDFQRKEEDLVHTSASMYAYVGLPHAQKVAMIRFTLSVGAYFRSTWSDGTDKQAATTLQKYFKSYVEVLSLCVGGLSQVHGSQALLDPSGGHRLSFPCMMVLLSIKC